MATRYLWVKVGIAVKGDDVETATLTELADAIGEAFHFDWRGNGYEVYNDYDPYPEHYTEA